jgi:hypothetical protein
VLASAADDDVRVQKRLGWRKGNIQITGLKTELGQLNLFS